MEVFVARQPIFDRNMKIFGYELLFRDSMSNVFPEIDGDTATSKLLANSFFAIGMNHITRGKKAFVNFTQELLVKKVPLMFPADDIIVEILEDVEPEEHVVNACQEIARNGYKMALDDFFYRADLLPLIALAEVIKFDLRLTPLEQVAELLNKTAFNGISLLAEKVETHDEFQQALEMGFKYFQGYFFSKPQIIKGRDVPPSKMNLLQIITEINKEDFSFEELEKYIQRDVAASYKLMRYINSAFFRRLKEITSIKQALILLGEKQVKHFISIVAMAELASDKPEELIRTSIIRAKLCELLGKNRGIEEVSELFTLGLFSHIDAILGDTMENLMGSLPFSESIKQALVNNEGKLADYLRLATSYEMGDWDLCSETADKIGLTEENIPESYMEAVSWADSYETI